MRARRRELCDMTAMGATPNLLKQSTAHESENW
jgi:hypothetical protein